VQKVIEGRFQGKKTPGRPRTMLLDALMQEVRLITQSSKKRHMTEKLGVNEKEPAFG